MGQSRIAEAGRVTDFKPQILLGKAAPVDLTSISSFPPLSGSKMAPRALLLVSKCSTIGLHSMVSHSFILRLLKCYSG